MENSFRALIEYAEQLGYWPSQKDWDEHARKNGYMRVTSMYYHHRKSWETLRKEYGFRKKGNIFSEGDCISALQSAQKSLGDFFTRREYADWRKDFPNLPSAGQISGRCGGFNRAKELAGLIPNEAWGKEFSEEEIVQALKDCATDLKTDLFSEEEYMQWNDGTRPHIETIRKRLGSLVDAKKKMGLDTYYSGPQVEYTTVMVEKAMIEFLADALNNDRYIAWSQENNKPSMTVVRAHFGTYEEMLFKMLPKYIERIQSGRRKRK